MLSFVAGPRAIPPLRLCPAPAVCHLLVLHSDAIKHGREVPAARIDVSSGEAAEAVGEMEESGARVGAVGEMDAEPSRVVNECDVAFR